MYNHDYYIKHKEEYHARTKKWRENNKERFYEIVYNYRKRKAEELKKQGLKYCWKSEKKRKELYERRNQRINKALKNGKIQDNNVKWW